LPHAGLLRLASAAWQKALGMLAAVAMSVAVPLAAAQAAAEQGASDTRFLCGGEIEARVWTEWDRRVRPFIETQVLGERLVAQGDVYALYDMESLTQNLVALAARCGRPDRLRQIAALLHQAYGKLESSLALFPGQAAHQRWVCRGGAVCNRRNRLLDREILLNSAQFLGLALRVASGLTQSAMRKGAAAGESTRMPLPPAENAFIETTMRVAADHLLRWHDAAAERRLQRAMHTRPAQMAAASTELLFTDFDLWQVAMYAELAGLLQWQAMPEPGATAGIAGPERVRLARNAGVLLDFLGVRLSYRRDPASRMGDAAQAELDRGYWRLLKESRYAGYLQDAKPLECLPAADGAGNRFRPTVRIPPEAVPPQADVGWDLSHARRLVPALDALERNRQAMLAMYRLSERRLPPAGLAENFANTLLATIWNGDTAAPLFANYWSGLNGWYRVAWDDGTGKCREGYPPYGMSEAFATGGYLAWSRYQPMLGVLGRRLYTILDASGAAETPFVQRYYPSLSNHENPGRRALARFAFLASLVGAGI
jgi:hypothetical protein